jgi:hypothetical protein
MTTAHTCAHWVQARLRKVSNCVFGLIVPVHWLALGYISAEGPPFST